jgi:hypothetical protein
MVALTARSPCLDFEIWHRYACPRCAVRVVIGNKGDGPVRDPWAYPGRLQREDQRISQVRYNPIRSQAWQNLIHGLALSGR